MHRISRYRNSSLFLLGAFFLILALIAGYMAGPSARPSAGLSAGPLARRLLGEPAFSGLPAEAASAQEPVFSPPGGAYDRDVRLQIAMPPSGALWGAGSWFGGESEVIFTIDGSVPTRDNGTVYTRPIHMAVATPAVTVVRARALLPDGSLGAVASASYFVGVPATLPMISLIVDPDDLWDPQRGIYANPVERGAEWERPVDITYVDQDRSSGFHISAGVRIHGQFSREFEKKSLRLYFRREYGASRLEYPLFADSLDTNHPPVGSFKRLILHSGGQDWHMFPDMMNWTLMRNRLVDRLAFELGGYATCSRPVLVFINGEPWGIYHIRERIDRFFLADRYGVESADFIEAPEHMWDQAVPMGDAEHWAHVLGFVETHDLAHPAHYAYLGTQIDLDNFIDYHVLQIYAANEDWPHRNVRQFRPRVQGGRWRWVFWDTDHCFGADPDGHVNLDVVSHLLDYNDPYTGGRDVLLVRKLLATPVFLERFLSRTADLLNTTLAPAAVIFHIDALAAELEPDMVYEIFRWSGPVDWEANVQEMRDFARQRPAIVRQHMVDRFNLDGTARLTFAPPAGGGGYVAVNGALLRDLPWQGVYFQGIPVQITAVPAPGYRFAGWESAALPQTPELSLTVQVTQTITPRFERADEGAPRPGDVVFTGYGSEGDAVEDVAPLPFVPGPRDQGQPVQGDWFTLEVMRPGGVDLRGWRVTDNDTKTAMDEGSLVFTSDPALARVPRGTRILVVVTSDPLGEDQLLTRDDVGTLDRDMTLYVANGHLDASADPGFRLGPRDNLVLLAPGPTQAFDDDQGIAFVATSAGVTPASFGVLSDGVLPELSSAGP